MKEQGSLSLQRVTEGIKIPTQGADVSPNHSRNLEEAQNDIHSNYAPLKDLLLERRTHLTEALDILTALGISEEALRIGKPLQTLLAKEMSCSRYFRWAFIDNFVEKILQGLLLHKQDISKENIKFCTSMIRQMPVGRSLLLHQACGLRKVYAARGFVLTTEMLLNQAVKISIAFFLGYRLYEQFTTGSSSFLEFTTIFQKNSEKGINSLVHLLAKVESAWLYLLLISPAIAGVLRGSLDTQNSQPLTESAITQLQEAVNDHTSVLLKKSHLWGDVLRQMISIPGFSSVSERAQRAEQQIRWDGRITNTQRASLFSNIERLALQGNWISKINAMQSLAKIVHSLSIKDFKRLRNAGYSQETLVQILHIKTQALRDLNMLSNRAPAQSEDVQQMHTTIVKQSVISMLYANYLLWWLGMGTCKYSLLFWSFKLGNLTLQGLFLKVLIESILLAIKCPDKQGFSIDLGEYPVWANQLTPDCFKEFVRQFRSINQAEPFESFLGQLVNFDFSGVKSIDLSDKALTSNETRQILNILYQRVPTAVNLTLTANKINETWALLFPDSLQFLDLSYNNISAAGAQGLMFRHKLQTLDLSGNTIGAEGAKGLKLPDSLQSLALSGNAIGAEGAKGLKLPDSLQSLALSGNEIGAEGAQGFKLPDGLRYLDLSSNLIGNVGAQGLKLPNSLQSLDLRYNGIGAEGAQGFKLPDGLQSLNLRYNGIGAEGARGLKLPDGLQSLDLGSNTIDDAGAQGLKLPGRLQSLDLRDNRIGTEGAQGLKLPDSLQFLVLSSNDIGVEGAQGLKLPNNLQYLGLGGNNIGAEGAQGLKLPDNLQYLELSGNNISDAGAQRVKLPHSLQLLGLGYNSIGVEGAQGLKLPDGLQFLDLTNNDIGNAGAQRLKLPDSLQSLVLQYTGIAAEGAQELKLPSSLQSLDLSWNNISDEGARRLKLPDNLQSLGLSDTNIGAEGAQGLKLPGGLQFLDLSYNYDIGDAGAQGLKLPDSLQSLVLHHTGIGAEGAFAFKLPGSLQDLELSYNNISDEGVRGLKLPVNLQFLGLENNDIGDVGINALLQKIPKTKLTTINLDGNPYNSTVISTDRAIQQQILLRNCQDQLCHANTPLWAQQDEYQTSSATRAQPPLFLSWLKKPFDKLSEYFSNCVSTTLDSLGTRLEKALSQSPSYFPNIHSSTIHDWQSSGSGSVMLHQFNTVGSNTLLLLSRTQIAIQPSLSAIAR